MLVNSPVLCHSFYCLMFVQAFVVIWVALKNQEKVEEAHKTFGGQRGIVGMVWDWIITIIVVLFLISIVNTSVQERLATLDQSKLSDHRATLRGRIKLLAE